MHVEGEHKWCCVSVWCLCVRINKSNQTAAHLLVRIWGCCSCLSKWVLMVMYQQSFQCKTDFFCYLQMVYVLQNWLTKTDLGSSGKPASILCMWWNDFIKLPGDANSYPQHRFTLTLMTFVLVSSYWISTIFAHCPEASKALVSTCLKNSSKPKLALLLSPESLHNNYFLTHGAQYSCRSVSGNQQDDARVVSVFRKTDQSKMFFLWQVWEKLDEDSPK